MTTLNPRFHSKLSLPFLLKYSRAISRVSFQLKPRFQMYFLSIIRFEVDIYSARKLHILHRVIISMFTEGTEVGKHGKIYHIKIFNSCVPFTKTYHGKQN
jgi:hypothetical protein